MRTLQALVTLLRNCDLVISATEQELLIESLVSDSRLVTPGALFVAERGSETDGHLWVDAAIERGAVAVVAERYLSLPVPLVIVHDSRAVLRLLATDWYGAPATELQLIGITGTNGKTTTTAMVRHLLNGTGSVGMLGTLGAFDGKGEQVQSTAGSLTTPGSLDLQATLRRLRDSGTRQVVMECSSHALDQGRLDGLRYQAAVFTNLTREHLDYHHSMEAYLQAKLRLAQLVQSESGVLAVNGDDPHWEVLLRDPRTVTWGLASGVDLRAENVVITARGTRFMLTGRFGNQQVMIPYLGEYNVGNALAAMTVALELGSPPAAVIERMADAPQVPGRLERLADSPVTVLRDYAHTPDAFERVLKTLRPLVNGKLVLVFGCGGDRDRGKRPEMGRIAAELADRVMLTEDNPRTEDPDLIIDEIAAGMPAGSWERSVDRAQGIRIVLAEAGPEDLVLLAGKGHEHYQIVGSRYLPFDEREIVREALGL